jgi:hypothetical protein
LHICKPAHLHGGRAEYNPEHHHAGVFAVFSVLYLREPLAWNHVVGFAFIAAGGFFVFHRW